MACSESSVISTPSKEPRAGESGTRWDDSGKARSKQREGGAPVYVIAGWIWCLSAGRGMVENNDCGVGGVANDDADESENVGDGVRGLKGGESPAGLCAGFVIGSKTRTRLP